MNERGGEEVGGEEVGREEVGGEEEMGREEKEGEEEGGGGQYGVVEHLSLDMSTLLIVMERAVRVPPGILCKQ